MLNHKFVANDIEKTFVYEKDGLRVNLSKLEETPSDPQCLSLAKYNKENGELVAEVKFYEEEQVLLQRLLNL